MNLNLFNTVLEKAYTLKNDKKITNPKTARQLRDDFDLELTNNSIKDEGQKKELLLSIIKESVNTQSPRFLNQLYGGAGDVTWLGELLTAVLNTSMATYEIAPLFTLMEKELIKAMNEKIGFKKMDGIMVPGGSYANMYAVHCARLKKDKSNKTKGLFGKKPYVAFTSRAAHYSTEKAMNLLGFGVDRLITVETDSNHKMNVEALEEAIVKSQQDGFEPFCIVSTAGTTVWGSFDPILEVQKLSDKFKLWHHVDAAWGGLALWSDKKDESYYKGLEQVDSITLDFHKLMASSLTKAIYICSQPEVFYEASSGGGSEYIFHSKKEDEMNDTGVYALQCGRKVDSLPLWLQWKFNGGVQFSDKFKELVKVRDYTVSQLKEKPSDFKLLHDPEFMNICFQVLPKNIDSNSYETVAAVPYSYNQEIRSELMKRGSFMVNFSKSDEHGTFFRLVLNHWLVTEDVIDGFLKELLEIRNVLLK